MADWKDILWDKEEQAAGDELMHYLKDELSDDEKHEFEKKTVDSVFVNDAVEGLNALADKQQLNQYVQQLNKNLQQQLALKKQRKQKRVLAKHPWILIAAIVLLAICVMGYFIIHLHLLNQ
ncbi:MAG: hypothetical protein LH478_02010 [Chitinophagaceae bacterium]|nr:hypothetical protein [Chitinophagaceae bacterium]